MVYNVLNYVHCFIIIWKVLLQNQTKCLYLKATFYNECTNKQLSLNCRLMPRPLHFGCMFTQLNSVNCAKSSVTALL